MARIEAQLAVTEVVHQFKPAKPSGWSGVWCDSCAEGAESDGNPTDSSFTAGLVRNLWELGFLNETSRDDIEGWPSQPCVLRIPSGEAREDPDLDALPRRRLRGGERVVHGAVAGLMRSACGGRAS